MHPRLRALAAMLLSISAASGPTPVSAAAPAIHNLGVLDGRTESHGSSINNVGQVSGTSDMGPFTASSAFLYSGTPGVDGQMFDLGTLGGTVSQGVAINASGQVAGRSTTAGNDYHAFLYTGIPGSGGVMHDLGTLYGAQNPDCRECQMSDASGINSSGQVVGSSNTATDVRAFLYTGTPGSGGTMTDLGSLGGPYTFGVDINDKGQVVGTSTVIPSGSISYRLKAFLYTGTPGSGGVMHDLGTLGGLQSYGNALNAGGQVTGHSHIAGNSAEHAFLYSGTPGSGGVMHDLGTLGGTNSAGTDINADANVVGWSYTAGNAAVHAFLYTGTPGIDGQMIDLDAWLDANNPAEGAKWMLGGERGGEGYGYAMNDDGLITGTGYYDDGPGGLSDGPRAFLLDASSLLAVPEPPSLALISLAVPALVCRRRRG